MTWPTGEGNSGWFAGGWHGDAWAQPSHQPTPVMWTEYEEEYESGTDSDTASSCWEGEMELPQDIPANATSNQVAETLFWAYQKAKSNWRRFMRKPTRAVRRFVRRPKGKGKGKGKRRFRKGKGKGFNSSSYLVQMSDQEVEQIFFGKGGGKGGRKGMRSTGKGKRPTREPQRTRRSPLDL